jgi:hypothetical protein
MPRQNREIVFGRGELTRSVLDELRGATGPVSSREVAQALVALSGQDVRDRKDITELKRRVSKTLRRLRAEEIVQSAVDSNGNVKWSIRGGKRGQPIT